MGLIGNLANLLASGSRYVPPPPPPTPQTGPDSTQSTSAAPSAAAQSVPRQGTPADTSPIRADFSPASQRADEDSARAFAVAAQARERLGDLVKGLADAPDTAPALSVVRAEKPEQPVGGAGINATLPTLRGENAAGAVLDKVA